MLNFEDFQVMKSKQQQKQDELNESNKAQLFAEFEKQGIKFVRVEFNGVGDSGQIDSVGFYQDPVEQQIPITPTGGDCITLQSVDWNAEVSTRTVGLETAVEDFCYDYLSAYHGGWENNDGADGIFEFNVETKKISFTINECYTEYNTTEAEL